MDLVAPAQVDVVVASAGCRDLAVLLVAGCQAAAECHASVAGIADAGACSSLDGDNVAQRLAIARRQRPGTDAHGDWHQPRGAPASRTTPVAADRFWTELEEAGGHAG